MATKKYINIREIKNGFMVQVNNQASDGWSDDEHEEIYAATAVDAAETVRVALVGPTA